MLVNVTVGEKGPGIENAGTGSVTLTDNMGIERAKHTVVKSYKIW